MKRIGITGVTGLVGSELARELRRQGMGVVGYSRALRPLEMADEVRSFQELDVRGLEAVVHLAGESILGRWTSEKKGRIRASRVDGTRRVVQALSESSEGDRPSALICASAIGFYGDRGDEWLTEASGPGKGFLAGVAQEWESEARKAEELGVRVVCGRLGVVLAAEGGAAPLWQRIFEVGLGGRLGSGRQWVSWVGIRDLVAMLVEAVRAEDLRGAVNLVAPNPVRNEELTRVIAGVAGRPAMLPVPAFALRLVLGGMEEMLLQSQRVEPAVLRGRGFNWSQPELEGALREVFGKAGRQG